MNRLKIIWVGIWLSLFLCSSPCSASQQLIIEPDMGRAPLMNAIKQTKSSVDLVMYGFTDLKFTNALAEANNKHKNTRVLLQHYPFRATDENQSAIQQLRADKIPLEWPDENFKLTHQKTFILDNDKVIIMTFNLTHSTFSKERNFALFITDPNITQEIKKVFNADWQHASTSVNNASLVWSPNNSREKLLACIRQAKSAIKIYAEGLSDYQIIGALAKASRSGVKVFILTSRFDNQQTNKKFAYLTKAGVDIRYSKDYIIHAKVMMIDHKFAVLGSINLTKQSIDSNRELSIITQDPSVITTLEKTFDRDWQHTSYMAISPEHKVDKTKFYLRNLKKIISFMQRQHIF